MNSSEAEIAELRARVARLESRMEQLSLAVGSSSAATPVPPLLSSRPVQGQTAAPAPQPDRTGESRPTVWIAGAGAVIFLIGVIYGLTVSIQRGWISPPVRVLAGIGTGAVLGIVAARLLLGTSKSLGVALLAAATGTWTFALYYGAQEAHLFALTLGFGGAALATLLAGALGAKARSDGALAVALATGLAAPLAFSDGSGRLPVLLAYLLVLVGTHLAANYLTGSGGQWRWSRVIGVAGTCWLAMTAAASAGARGDPEYNLVLAGALGLILLVLAWLPRHPERPWLPGAATVTIQLALGLIWWNIWRRARFDRESFSLLLAGLAAVSLTLVPPARRRVGSGTHDLPLFLLTAGFTLVAMAMAFEWRWVVVAWGTFAALTAWATRSSANAGRDNTLPLQFTAGLAATAASAVWLGLAWSQGRTDLIFLNRVFLGGVLAAAAWAQLVASPGSLRPVSFVVLQLVAVNVLARELARAVPSVQIGDLNLAVGALLATLVYATAGAGQWLRGINRQTDGEGEKALRLAGYGWLGAAAGKLLLYDLGGTDLLFRAVAALGVGAIFIGAALWANHQRVSRPAAER